MAALVGARTPALALNPSYSAHSQQGHVTRRGLERVRSADDLGALRAGSAATTAGRALLPLYASSSNHAVSADSGRHPRHSASTLETTLGAAAEPANSSGGGGGGGSTNSSSEDVQALRQEVTELRQMLQAQALLVDQQQEVIRQLQGYLTGAEAGARVPADTRSIAEQQQEEGQGQLPPEGQGSPEAQQLLMVTPSRASTLIRQLVDAERQANRQLATAPIADRRQQGWFDARFHSTAWGATPRDYRILPRRIILVRHAESEGNVDNIAYTYLPDPKVPLTARGWQQALEAGEKIKSLMEGEPYQLHFYTSPYLRSKQTYEGLVQAFAPEQLAGIQEEVQLREQDFGNFQDAEGKQREKAERLRFGRFFYRFPNGESGADVYDRMTLFEDHLVRDINAGRFANNTSLVLITHGLALRIFLMRWFHWTVEQFMSVYNPPNAEPLVLERVSSDYESRQGGPTCWIHTKSLYRLASASREVIKGCSEDMCSTSWVARGLAGEESSAFYKL